MVTQLLIKVDPAMKDRLAKLARNEGKSASQIVRELIESYVRERDVGAYIDGLWQRIGGKLESKDVKARDVKTAVRFIRQKHAQR